MTPPREARESAPPTAIESEAAPAAKAPRADASEAAPAAGPTTETRMVVLAATETGRRLGADLAAHLGGEHRTGRLRDLLAAAWTEADALVLVIDRKSVV